MSFIDFEYDGVALRELGYMICSFDGSSDVNTILNGADIKFNTASARHGTVNYVTSTVYEDTLETSFQICKNPCKFSDLKISVDEIRELSAWLCRPNYNKLRFIDDDGERLNIYYEASFNISRLEINDGIYGLELNVATNKPYAIGDTIVKQCFSTDENWSFAIRNESDESCFIYPYMEIEIISAGDLTIENTFDGSKLVINNCSANEIITIDYPLITSSDATHKLPDDFNWNFPTFSKTRLLNENTYEVNLPAKIKFSYTPVVMFGM